MTTPASLEALDTCRTQRRPGPSPGDWASRTGRVVQSREWPMSLERLSDPRRQRLCALSRGRPPLSGHDRRLWRCTAARDGSGERARGQVCRSEQRYSLHRPPDPRPADHPLTSPRSSARTLQLQLPGIAHPRLQHVPPYQPPTRGWEPAVQTPASPCPGRAPWPDCDVPSWSFQSYPCYGMLTLEGSSMLL